MVKKGRLLTWVIVTGKMGVPNHGSGRMIVMFLDTEVF